MNKQFKPSFNTTVKPSDTRYNTLMLFTIIIILLLVCIHLYRYGIDMNIKVPSNSDTLIAKKEIPQEVMETAQKVKERLTKVKEYLTEIKEDPTTMQQVYYYGKIILGFAVVVGVLYLCYKYEMSMNAPTGNTGGGETAFLTKATTSTPAAPLNPIKVEGPTVTAQELVDV